MLNQERRSQAYRCYFTYLAITIQCTLYYYILYCSLPNPSFDTFHDGYTFLKQALNTQDLINWGGNIYLKTTQGDWWRLLTAPLLHLNPFHLMSNLIVFYVLASLMEKLIGSVNVFILFTGSAVLSGLCSILYYDFHVAVGSSGGIYGLMGGGLVYLRVTHAKRLHDVRRQLLLVILLLIYTSWINLYGEQSDHVSHWSGFLVGAILGVPIGYTMIYKDSYLSALIVVPSWRTLSICIMIGVTALGLRYFPEPSTVARFMTWFEQQEQSINQLNLPKHEYSQQRWIWLDQIDPILHRAEVDLHTLQHYARLTPQQSYIVDILTHIVFHRREYFAQRYINPLQMTSLHKASAQYHLWMADIYQDRLYHPSQLHISDTENQKQSEDQSELTLMLRTDLWGAHYRSVLSLSIQGLKQLQSIEYTQSFDSHQNFYLILLDQNIKYLLSKYSHQLYLFTFEEIMMISTCVLRLTLYNHFSTLFSIDLLTG